MALAHLLNTAWMASCWSEARAWERATTRVSETQALLLLQMLRANAETEYGRSCGFDRIDSPKEYQRRTPLSSYETYETAIERIAAGESHVLTREPTLLFEPTSGTTRGEKLIPYTATLRRQFQRMAAAWIYDLLRNRPAIRRGRAYWSISPAMGGPRRTSGGIPLGFDDDTAYLGAVERLVARRLLAVPPAAAKIQPIEEFRCATLRHLLQSRDLALISVWSPTFLEALFMRLDEWSERLCRQVRGNDPELAAILRCNQTIPEKLRRIWPQLALISCWCDGAAARFAERIRELFPAVEIQPKGLLATEGCVSFPLLGYDGAALALRSHFFEFQEHDASEDDSTACRLAHELDRGGRYRVVLTTGGGFYRYRLGDIVEAAGAKNRCPLVRFVGRARTRSDLVGEKLEDALVQDVLDRALRDCDVEARFALLAPSDEHPPRYRLYLQPLGESPSPIRLQLLVDAVQVALEVNPHYRYAVDLEQLAPAELVLLEAAEESAWMIYERRRLVRGQKAGDIKPASLDRWTGWDEEFAPLRDKAQPVLQATRTRQVG